MRNLLNGDALSASLRHEGPGWGDAAGSSRQAGGVVRSAAVSPLLTCEEAKSRRGKVTFVGAQGSLKISAGDPLGTRLAYSTISDFLTLASVWDYNLEGPKSGKCSECVCTCTSMVPAAHTRA